MPKPRPPHLIHEATRHGRRNWYVRKGHGPRIRLRAPYDTQAFWAEYRAALEGAPKPSKATRAQSLQWGIDRYRASSAWAALATATRRQSENIFGAVIKTAGEDALSAITAETIRAGRERRAAAPHAANNFLKTMRRFFKWASDPQGGALVSSNPTLGVKLLKGKNKDGFHTWTNEEITRFEARWPIGTRERLALDLLLYTGLSRGDVVRLGRQHVSGGVITFRMEKERGDGVVYPPVLPVLAATIAATKTGDLTFLVSERGSPMVKESFGNWFREACREAGCPGSAHGLRKAGATRAAENGATVNQLMALFGWRTEKMALVYTRKADRKRLAAQAGPLLAAAQISNENLPHLGSGAGDSANDRAKSGA
ncbi:MAG: tyrosine-type recombinase/integrase [Pseudorhodoplanes sp.]|uniref:tyrosine-type recombinase/integrase n=1 Tax=Pseudorhodoplanes sp. TaxID=1934341 RepID=UPI003D0CF47D